MCNSQIHCNFVIYWKVKSQRTPITWTARKLGDLWIGFDWIHLILWARPLFLLTQATLMMVVVGLRSRDGLCSLWSKRAFYSTAGQTSVGASWALAPQTKRAPRRRGMRQLDKRCNCIAKHELLDLTHLATSCLLQIKCFPAFLFLLRIKSAPIMDPLRAL